MPAFCPPDALVYSMTGLGCRMLTVDESCGRTLGLLQCTSGWYIIRAKSQTQVKVMKSVLTPLEFLARSAAVYPSCTAVVDGGRRLTYGEFQQRVHSFGAALQQAGIAEGDRVAVLARNGLLPLEAHFAVPLIGAVLVTLNIRLQGGELATIMNHSGARIVLGDADLLAPLHTVRKDIPKLERMISDYEAFLGEGSRPVAPHAPSEEDVISINYTS